MNVRDPDAPIVGDDLFLHRALDKLAERNYQAALCDNSDTWVEECGLPH
jgi:hypothetical protein